MSRLRLMVLGASVVAAIWASVNFGVNRAVNNVLFSEAIDEAMQWGNLMAEHIPDIETLIHTGIPDEEQQAAIHDIKELGNIFRFKLFSPEGHLVFISDYLSTNIYKGVSTLADPEPKQVADTRNAIVDVKDGTQKPNRPDLYAEAYIPLEGQDGSLLGVVEVYVDQTATASYFKDSFQMFGVFLMLLCGAIFAIPGLAYSLQRSLTERTRKDAEHLARLDPLTGLLNRREFALRAKNYLKRGDLSIACYLDLDNFKTINDTHGHAVGDEFLAHVATVLRNNCRKNDLIARFGGDEFVIGFHDITTDNALQRVKTILQLCAEQFEVEGANLVGSVSIGLVEVAPEEDLDTILKNADTALYCAKTSGRNTFAIYGDEMGQEAKQRFALETRIRWATENRKFEIFFQPLVSSADKQVVGHEALLRLKDAEGNFIPPTVFIPIAENLGLIDEIGQWTIRGAIQQASIACEHKTLAINLSSIQFESGELVNTVREALEDANFPANQLELEITESLLLEDSISVQMQIDTLREMGVRIAMDDFGTGFSSLSYLWKYGFDRLKIDRSFVAALEQESERSREVIESVVMLGARLNMKITAEGVETIEQSKFLSDLGCDTLQGYLYGKPAPFKREDVTQGSLQIEPEKKTG